MTDGRATFTSAQASKGDMVVSPVEVGLGEWHHFALVRGPDHNRVSLYVDGIAEVGSASGIGGDVTIEALLESLTGSFEGRVDEIRIWDLARSPAEIRDNAAQPLDLGGGVPTGLERYFSFDTDTDHLIDLAGNGETGHDLHFPAGVSVVNDPASEQIHIGDVAGFLDTQIAGGLFLPTDMDFLPDGRMLVTTKDGFIYIFEDPTVANSPSELYMDISSFTINDREAGLLNIELDPDFANNGYFYLMYSNDTVQRTTVSRFQHQENAGGTASRGDVSSETVLWREFDTYSGADHQGGGLTIAYEPIDANDPSPYKVYIAIGETRLI